MTFIDVTDHSAPLVRYPQAWLKINGQNIPCIKATVTRKSERSADTFSVDLSLTQPADFGMTTADWADYQPSDVEVLMSLEAGGANPVSMITGQIDEPQINWMEMTVSASGRDKSSTLTENRRSQKFQNQNSADIVSAIVKEHGLTVSASQGMDFAGKIYDQDTNHLVLNRSDHEVLSDLAEREGFRWYVDGKTLYFEPKGTDNGSFALTWYPPGSQAAYAVGNFFDLTTNRNMTAAKPHSITVQSWHHRDKTKYTGAANAGGVGTTVNITHQHNGKTQSQAGLLAASRLKNAIRHDCNITAKAPAILTADVRQTLSLDGTGTIYDQDYEVDSIEFEVDEEDGAMMSVHAKSAKAGREGSDGAGTPNTPAASTPATTVPLGQGGIGHA